ncbi:hypothetical protein FRB98_001105 [Tulasnella sp. 332]|nr:hypothetical protein FRB98_001105 [Tulasnella sp. 332]
MDDNALTAKEAYLLLLLSDANLPTGSFVASSGLESYIKHGFFSDRSPESPFASSSATDPQPPHATVATVNFLRDSLQTYARSTLALIQGVHEAMEGRGPGVLGKTALKEIVQLDGLYEAMTLNHVARRASKAQGVALLTLYTKASETYHMGFSRPSWLPDSEAERALPGIALQNPNHDTFVHELKSMVRRGDTPGHLPICWAVLSASLGLSTQRSQHLHIFLHARALLSASVRLNTVGPYASQQLLLHVVKPLVEDAVRRCKDIRLTFVEKGKGDLVVGSAEANGDDDWELDEEADGPASTWPLGEIIAGRHDLQHSRIFNS